MPFPPSVSHQSVRRLLDPELAEADLADGVIDDPLFAGDAEDEVRERVPDAGSYAADSANYARVTRLWALLTAARLAVAWRPVQRQDAAGGDVVQQWAAWDGAKRAAELRAQAAEVVAAVTPDTAAAPLLSGMFATVSGRRG